MNISHSTSLIPISYIQSPRLKIVKIRRRVRLPISILARQPCFYVVLFDLPQSQISPAIYNDAIWKFQFLKKRRGVLRQLFVKFYRLFVACLAQNHLLVFHKFVYSENPFRVFAVTSGFAPETGRERKKFDGQIFLLQNFIHVIPHRSDFCSTREIGFILRFIKVILTLRKISSTDERLSANNRGYYHRREALPAGRQAARFHNKSILDKPLERPHQTRAVIL